MLFPQILVRSTDGARLLGQRCSSRGFLFVPLKKKKPEMPKSLFYQTINTLALSGKDPVLPRGKSSGHR